jgi:PelA/Pel-15E family pectate lyase
VTCWRTAAAILFAAWMWTIGGLGAQVPVAWRDILRQPDSWYASAEGRRIADVVLQHQRTSGGWPKDTDMTRPPEPAVLDAAARRPDSTIDNGATVTEIRMLARVFSASGEARYRAAVVRGIDYLLAAQYPDGGWPQFFPLRDDYSRHITFNDNAMVGAMSVLDDVARGRAPLDVADAAGRDRARAAVARGVDIILRTQIRVNDQLTAWCAQHDEVTLEARGARTYEHPSLSGQESVGIVRFLMTRERPDVRIVRAVDSAVAWLRQVRLSGLRVERRRDAATGLDDVVAIHDANAPPIWARFYEIGTNRPIFSGRDGAVRRALADIEQERRSGYAWYGSWPQLLVEQEYPAWRTRIRRNGR